MLPVSSPQTVNSILQDKPYLSWAVDYIFQTAAFQMHLDMRITDVGWIVCWLDGQMDGNGQ